MYKDDLLNHWFSFGKLAPGGDKIGIAGKLVPFIRLGSRRSPTLGVETRTKAKILLFSFYYTISIIILCFSAIIIIINRHIITWPYNKSKGLL